MPSKKDLLVQDRLVETDFAARNLAAYLWDKQEPSDWNSFLQKEFSCDQHFWPSKEGHWQATSIGMITVTVDFSVAAQNDVPYFVLRRFPHQMNNNFDSATKHTLEKEYRVNMDWAQRTPCFVGVAIKESKTRIGRFFKQGIGALVHVPPKSKASQKGHNLTYVNERQAYKELARLFEDQIALIDTFATAFWAIRAFKKANNLSLYKPHNFDEPKALPPPEPPFRPDDLV